MIDFPFDIPDDYEIDTGFFADVDNIDPDDFYNDTPSRNAIYIEPFNRPLKKINGLFINPNYVAWIRKAVDMDLMFCQMIWEGQREFNIKISDLAEFEGWKFLAGTHINKEGVQWHVLVNPEHIAMVKPIYDKTELVVGSNHSIVTDQFFRIWVDMFSDWHGYLRDEKSMNINLHDGEHLNPPVEVWQRRDVKHQLQEQIRMKRMNYMQKRADYDKGYQGKPYVKVKDFGKEDEK